MQDLVEKIGYEERMRRSKRLHNLAHKLLKRRELLANKMASQKTLMKRANKLARIMLRKRLGGKNYEELTTAQKMRLDDVIDRIPLERRKELAARMLPYVYKAERARLDSIRKHKASLKEESLRSILRRSVDAKGFKKIRRALGKYIKKSRPATTGAKQKASSRAGIKASEKQAGIKSGSSAYEKHARRHFRLKNFDKVRKNVADVINRADKNRLSNDKITTYANRITKDLMGGKLQLADFEHIQVAELLYEADEARLDKLFRQGLVDRKKIPYYKRILKNVKRSLRFREYQKPIADLLDSLLDYVTKDDVLYRRLRFEILGKKKVPVSEGKNYYTGLSPSTKKKREAEFKRGAKKHWKDPSAYPDDHTGDEDKKTKKSKYTKAAEKRGLAGDALSESADSSLRKKAEKSGIPFSILKQVYNRGMAAWRTGHRPGATQQQWAHARVNSFLTGGKTRSTADKDLWQKAQKSKGK